jgi:ABC-type Fe3+/spermidine/putrescine transport system ATPase subunit
MSWSVSLRARRGSFTLDISLDGDHRPVALVGPNGSGKSSLLRVIAGAVPASAGRIEVNGRTLYDAEQGIDRPPEERGVGYVPQGFGLFPHLCVVENVAFGLGEGAREARRREALRMLEELGCADLAERMPARLSGGEKQRVALARALVVNPRLLLLDEPLAAMDISARRTMRSFLAGHLRSGERPAIVVTHDPRDVLALGAEAVVIEGGHVVQRGTPEELSASPATEFVEEFFA